MLLPGPLRVPPMANLNASLVSLVVVVASCMLLWFKDAIPTTDPRILTLGSHFGPSVKSAKSMATLQMSAGNGILLPRLTIWMPIFLLSLLRIVFRAMHPYWVLLPLWMIPYGIRIVVSLTTSPIPLSFIQINNIMSVLKRLRWVMEKVCALLILVLLLFVEDGYCPFKIVFDEDLYIHFICILLCFKYVLGSA